MFRKGLLYIVLLVSSSVQLLAAGFEGSITFVKESFYDTTYMVCYVKGNMIRLEELSARKQLINVFLVDTQKESVVMVNTEKRLYSNLPQKQSNNHKDDNLIIQKTGLTKTINGELCYQWRVKSKDSNAEIAYWVTQNDFYFFEKLALIFENTQTNWKFFTQIPRSQGFFPMMCVERNLVRDEKQRTRVMQINRKQISASLFKVPGSYKQFIL